MSVFDENDYPEWFDIAKSYGYSDFDATKAAFKYTALDSDSSNIVKTFSMISSGAKEAAANVEVAEGGLGGFFSVIKKGAAGAMGGLKGLWTSLSAFGKIGVVLAGITAAVAIYNKIQNAGVEANQKMADAVSAYKQDTTDLESLNNQLDATKQNIYELQSKGGLTILEKGQLEELKETNRQLEIQKDLLEKMALKDAKETASKTTTAIRKNYSNLPTSEAEVEKWRSINEGYGWGATPTSSNISSQLSYLQHLKDLQSDTEYGSDLWKTYQSEIDTTTDLIWSAVSAWEGYKSTLEDLPEEALSDKDKTDLNDLISSIETAYKMLDPAKWKQIKLDDFLAGADISSEKDKLVKAAKKNKYKGITADDLSKEFVEAAQNSGLENVLGKDYIQAIVDQINSEAGVVNVPAIKKSLHEKYGQTINNKEAYDWIENLSNEDTELVYKLSLDAGSANWTLEQWQQRLADLKSGADTAIADFQTKVSDAIDTQNKLVSAFAAGNSATGMTNEQIKEVCDSFKELDGFEIDKLFERTATGVQMNADAFENFNKQIQNQNLIELYTALEAKQNKFNKAKSESDKEAYLSDIQQLELLINELEAATSKYNAFVTASSSANRRDSFSNVAAGYKSVKTLLDQGWVSDDSVTSYLDLLLGDGWEAKTEGDAKKAFFLTLK